MLAIGPADERPNLTTHIDPCLELDELALRETSELRLGPGLEHRGDAPARDRDTQLLFDCASEHEAELTLVDPISGVTMTRIVELPPAERRVERIAELAVALLRPGSTSRSSTRAKIGPAPAGWSPASLADHRRHGSSATWSAASWLRTPPR